MTYEDFDNGLEINSAVNETSQTDKEKMIKGIFEKVQISDFLVPYRDKINNIPILNTPEKGKLIPAFSSYEEFLKCPLPKDKVTVMPFSKIDEIVTKSAGQISGIIVNPNGKTLIFEKNNKGSTPKNPMEVRFMKPEGIPEAIVFTLSNYLATCQNVYSAYLLWAQKESDLAPHLFLIIDFDGKGEEFFPKVANVIRPHLNKGNNIEIAKADLKLLNAAEKLVKPFYKKP